MGDGLVERVARALAGYTAENGYSDEDWACAPDQVRWRDQARAAVAAAGVETLRARADRAEAERDEAEQAVVRLTGGWEPNEDVLRLRDLIARAERAEAALRWYAAPDTYDHIGPLGTVKGSAWKLAEDGGARARAALGPPGQEGNDEAEAPGG